MIQIGKKIDYCPLVKINDDLYQVSWNCHLCDEETQEYSWDCIYVPSNSTAKNIITIIYNYINSFVAYNIINNFVWKGYNVYLSTENQANYKANYDLAINTNGSNLPVVFKFEKDNKSVYYTFNTIDELTDFYAAMVNHINTMLANGWKMKDNIVESQYTI